MEKLKKIAMKINEQKTYKNSGKYERFAYSVGFKITKTKVSNPHCNVAIKFHARPKMFAYFGAVY